MKPLVLSSFFLFNLTLLSQVTLEYSLDLFPDTKTYDGKINICNNSGTTLPGGYTIKAIWPAVETITYGLVLNETGSDNCDSVALSTESWTPISNGTCELISIGGEYSPPMFLPPKATGPNGEEITIVHSGTSYIPGAENGGSPIAEFYFDESCFIHAANELHVGEATLNEWNVKTDMFFPENKKHWAIANIHAHTLFTNLIGKEIISPNHFNATTLNESRCGCESDIIPDPSSTNPLIYQAGTVNDGCFQMTTSGWQQIDQFFPEFLDGLSHASNVPGDYTRSCILRAYYDMTSLLYWEKAKCFDPLNMFENSSDPYFAEEVLGMAFYRGFDPDYFETLFSSKRAVYLAEENIMEALDNNNDADNAAIIYGARQRNNAKQLDNNLVASWATNSPYYKPEDFNWKGWYNDLIEWQDVETYLNEIAPLFPRVNWTLLKAEIQMSFNAINGGDGVPFTELGPVIDDITLNLPAFDGNKGMSVVYNSDIENCNSSAISITSCSTLCPGEKGEITVNLMGTPPFNYSITGPNGETYDSNNVSGSPVILNVSDPGNYTVNSFSDANNSPFINCHFATAEVYNSGTDDVNWDTTEIDNVLNCIDGPLKLIGSGDGPWLIDYNFNGIAQPSINFSSSPYEVANIPNYGNYKITRMQAGGCDSPNNAEVDICLRVNTSEVEGDLFKLFPNPSTNKLFLEGVSEEETYFIYNVSGAIVKQGKYNNSGITINNLFQGYYFLKLNNQIKPFQKINSK